MDLVLTYVPASFKKATILPNSTQFLLSSDKGLTLLTVYRSECHFSEERRQDRSYCFEDI